MTRMTRVHILIPGINTEIISSRDIFIKVQLTDVDKRRSDGLPTDSASCLRRARRRSLHM